MIEPPSQPPKEDPETLVLRAQPKPVVRFKRPVLIGTVAIGCAGIFAVTWMGLGTPVPKAAQPKELYNPDAKANQPKTTPEALASLPASYAQVPAGVPQLGPPLPGDLGGPILSKQRGSADVSAASYQGHASAAPAASGVFFQVSSGGKGVDRITEVASAAASGPSNPFDIPLSPSGISISETASAVRLDDSIYNAHALQTPASPYQVMAGTVITATLVTGLNSDLPGMVIAQVSSPIFDTVSGRLTLIPQGTRLLGEYESNIAFGQSRLLLVWKRLIMPNGSSLLIDNFPATDSQGYSGLSDQVDYHTWSLLKGVGLSTLLGLTAYDGASDDSDLVQAFHEATRQTANQSGQQLVAKAIGIKPSLTIRPGWPVRVVVQKDLILIPYEERTVAWPN